MLINSMKRQIAGALIAKLSEITEIKYLAFDVVRVNLDDFHDNELPAVQIFDSGTSIEHQRTQLEKTWEINVEIVMKTTNDGAVNQLDLWDMEATIERKIGENPNLSIPRVRHVKYTGNKTDLHFTGPHYTARLIFEVIFQEPYTADC